MKRLLFAFVPLFLLAPSASAQTVEIIPQLGLLLTSYSGDQVESSIGAGISLGGKARFGRRLYLDGGVFWAYSGGNLDLGVAGSDQFYIGSIRVPVTVGYRILAARAAAFRIFGGADIGFTTNVGSTNLGLTKDDVKNTQWWGRVGAGVDLLILAIDAGYMFGLSDVFESTAGAGVLSDVKSNSWFLDVGLRFGF